MDFLYLSGNHDDDNFINGEEQLPQNLKVFGSEWTKFTYGDVVISGVKLSSKNSDSIYDSLKLDKDKLNIVTLHGQVVGYKSSEVAEKVYSNIKNRVDKVELIKPETEKFNKELIIIPTYIAKGLEFDSVIIINDFEKEKYLYYVAITRAQHELIVFNSTN